METKRFELGEELKDKITGFRGIAITRVEFLNGCIQYGLKPKCNDKEPNKMPEAVHVDVAQLEYADAKKNKVEITKSTKPTGGDMPDTPRGL